MEQQMRERITANLPQLIDLTICSTKFLAIFRSKSVFSRSDTQLIETEERNKGQLAACSKFYDLLTSRSGSFEVLLEALTQTSQTGALHVLNTTSGPVNAPLKFNSRSPKYILDYINQQDKDYLLVRSDDCKLTCDWIMESTPNCKIHSVTEILSLASMSLESFGEQHIFLANLEKNLDPIYLIEENTSLNIVFVTGFNKLELEEKIKNATATWKVVEDKIQWSDLSSHTKFGITSSLKQNLSLDGTQLTNALREIHSKTLIDLLNDKFFLPESLFCETIPLPIKYYVPRTLKTRNVIGKEMFEDELCDDFVLFSGIERFTLSEICQPHLTESSSNLLRNKLPTSQFVCLENEEDFEGICNEFQQYSVHLLEYQGGKFIWKKSRGNISTMHKYVAAKQLTLDETEFVSQILAQTSTFPICISDTPGKGKSTLLAKLATEAKVYHKTGIVAFIFIKEFIQRLKESKSISSSNILLSISYFVSSSNLGHTYLTNNKHYLRELFFDGFDEIDADETEFAFKCINRIRFIFSETRIWITSRPHMLPELERSLETLGYNITSFSKKDQVIFLSSFWSSRIKNCDSEIMSHFAKECLKTLKASLHPMREDIAGIPLQCLLIGEAYEVDAKRFVKSASSKTAVVSQQITSISDLYKRFIQKKIQIFQNRYNASNLTTPEIFNAHIRLALETLYPSHVTNFSHDLVHNMSRQEIFDFGLIKANSVVSSFKFLHRTFAEYFVALFVSRSLKNSPSEVLLDFLFTDIMMTTKTGILINKRNFSRKYGVREEISIMSSKFRHNVTCYFLNTFLGTLELSISFLGPERIRSLAEACIYHDLENLFFKFVPENKFTQDVITKATLILAVYRTGAHFLNTITREYLTLNSSRPLIVINLYRLDNSNSNQLNVPISPGDKDTKDNTPIYNLLHLAMRKADYATVDFLITLSFRTSVKNNPNGMYNNLIHCLLENSTSNSDWIVAEQRLIINYLATLNPDLLIRENEDDEFPLEAKAPHLDLLLEVWNLSKNFYSKINVLIRLLNTLTVTLSCDNLCRFMEVIFLDLEKGTTDKIISGGNLREFLCEMEGLNTNLLIFLKDRCSSFCDLNSGDRIHIFMTAVRNQEEDILGWLLNNLPYTSEDVKSLLLDCFDNLKINGITAILSHVQRLNSLENPPNFHEIFEFLFSANQALSGHSFTIVNLLNFYLWKTRLKYFEKMESETTLTHLIKLGLSYVDKLITQSIVNSSDGSILKLVWITYICSNLKTEIFLSRLKKYSKGFDLKTKDGCGNTLLHIFSQYFGFHGSNMLKKSFLAEMQFSNSFRDICTSDDDDSEDEEVENDEFGDDGTKALNIWKALVESGMNILQSNIHNQTPICLLLNNKRYDHEKVTDAVLFAANHLTTQDNWIMEDVHHMFYLIIKSHSIEVVEQFYKWYAQICELRNIKVAEVKTTFGNEMGNFLDAAINSGNGDVVKFVINALQIHVPHLLPNPTCVHHSIQQNPYHYQNKNTAKYILHLGQIFPNEVHQLVNQPNERNLVPLSLADTTSDVVKVLHDFGANINATDDEGNTPLHLTLMEENFSFNVAEQLIKCGSNVNAQNSKMKTPLFNLVQNVNLSSIFEFGINCFEMLMTHKADPSIPDTTGNTSAHILVQKNDSHINFHRVVQILISNEFGDVLTMRNSDGLTPLQIAEKFFHIEEHTRELLIENGIFDLDSNFNTNLHR